MITNKTLAIKETQAYLRGSSSTKSLYVEILKQFVEKMKWICTKSYDSDCPDKGITICERKNGIECSHRMLNPNYERVIKELDK